MFGATQTHADITRKGGQSTKPKNQGTQTTPQRQTQMNWQQSQMNSQRNQYPQRWTNSSGNFSGNPFNPYYGWGPTTSSSNFSSFPRFNLIKFFTSGNLGENLRTLTSPSSVWNHWIKPYGERVIDFYGQRVEVTLGRIEEFNLNPREIDFSSKQFSGFLKPCRTDQNPLTNYRNNNLDAIFQYRSQYYNQYR